MWTLLPGRRYFVPVPSRSIAYPCAPCCHATLRVSSVLGVLVLSSPLTSLTMHRTAPLTYRHGRCIASRCADQAGAMPSLRGGLSLPRRAWGGYVLLSKLAPANPTLCGSCNLRRVARSTSCPSRASVPHPWAPSVPHMTHYTACCPPCQYPQAG